MKKVIIVYHRVDYDGLFSAGVAKWALTKEGYWDEIEMLGWTHGDPMPKFDEMEFDAAILVDISFPPNIMKWLKGNVDVIWIDHHVTALNLADSNGYNDIDGLRRIGQGACELTWEFFTRGARPPMTIQYLSAYDVWDHSRFNWDIEIVPFQLALKAQYGMNFDKIYENFDNFMTDAFSMDHMLEAGRMINDYEKQQFKAAVKTYSFPVTVAGKYKGICILTNSMGSRIFESVKDDYDIYMTANRKTDETTGSVYFTLGMYMENGRLPEFNCGEYLQSRFGSDKAGGHAGAAGTQLNLADFEKLIMKGEI